MYGAMSAAAPSRASAGHIHFSRRALRASTFVRRRALWLRALHGAHVRQHGLQRRMTSARAQRATSVERFS